MQTTQPGEWEVSVAVPVNERRETSEAAVQRFSFHSSLSVCLSPLAVLAISFLYAKDVPDFVNPG
jgi:hypothetical protein